VAERPGKPYILRRTLDTETKDTQDVAFINDSGGRPCLLVFADPEAAAANAADMGGS